MAWRPKLGRQCGERPKKMKGGGTRPHPAAPDTYMSVCRRDGGDSLRGQAHPGYKDGKWSAFVPEPLLPTFTKALESGDLLSGMRTLAMMAAREEMLLKRLDTGETGKTWTAIRQQWNGLQRARDAEDDKAIGEHLVTLNLLINKGTADAEAWMELFELWERARRVSESEVRRREKARMLVPAEDALWHMRMQGDAVHDVTMENPGLFAGPEEQRRWLTLVMERYNDSLGSRVPKPQLEVQS